MTSTVKALAKSNSFEYSRVPEDNVLEEGSPHQQNADQSSNDDKRPSARVYGFVGLGPVLSLTVLAFHYSMQKAQLPLEGGVEWSFTKAGRRCSNHNSLQDSQGLHTGHHPSTKHSR
jgi:hypothetical protein